MSASLELDIDAIETQLKEYEQRSVASNIAGDNIVINAKNKATIQGSNLQANNNIDIEAQTTDITASKDNHDQSEDTQHQNVNISIGTSGFSMSASADNSESTNVQATHVNSDLQANNININTKETITIKGATIKAEDTLTLNSKNLEVASVQNTSKQKSHSEGVSAGVGGGTLTSLGANASNSDAKAKETLLTSLTGNKVDINTEQETRLRGATIAAVDADGNDNSNLNLKTDTLLASSLNNTKTSKSTSVGINLGGSAKENTLSNVSLDYSNDRTNSKTKTLATLGNGNIQIGNKEDSDTKMLNTDIANNEVDIYNISSHKGLKVELDTRLLTEDGRNSIKKDFLDSKNHAQEIAQTVEDIATTEKTILDYGSQIKKYVTDRELLASKAADKDTQENLKGEGGADASQEEIQGLSNDLSQKDGLTAQADVNLYDGSQTPDDTPVNSQNDFNKELSNAGYYDKEKGIFVNVATTDMTNSAEVVRATLHEQERFTQAQNGETNTLSDNSQTDLSKTRGERGATVWSDYSGLNGYSTKSETTQTAWNTNNLNTASIQAGTSKMQTINSADVEPMNLLTAIVESALVVKGISTVANIIKDGKSVVKAVKKVEIKRPSDIPDDWIEVPSKNGGKIWKDPKNPEYSNTRIELGRKNQANPQSYRKDLRDGKYYDKNGNVVSKNSREAHQLLE